uniref:Uncharacterized protein n=1 Tax=Aegilops tauschii subsp. strangulata TaxID=200361 RepID=A0A453BL27_AEGTS
MLLTPMMMTSCRLELKLQVVPIAMQRSCVEQQKNPRNRGSQECLTELYADFDDAQKETAKEMGMQALMNISGDDFKRKLLMDLISNFFAPTTSLRPNSRCFPILDHIGNVANMNWCKFIVGFLHTSLFNKMYNKGCRLHLMLMYVDKLDISTVNLNPVGGLPPSHKFSTSAWSDATTKAVLTADKKLDGTLWANTMLTTTSLGAPTTSVNGWMFTRMLHAH